MTSATSQTWRPSHSLLVPHGVRAPPALLARCAERATRRVRIRCAAAARESRQVAYYAGSVGTKLFNRVAAILVRDGAVLTHEAEDETGAVYQALPGGHLETDES